MQQRQKIIEEVFELYYLTAEDAKTIIGLYAVTRRLP